ncbi:MAG: hypothetical protein D6719_09930 [Candidatus Dadabacteria bacterium]|nr:MAG: hypothetical protein D6719_09930 [Candidatus Dadabacteria bacterium]
MKTRACPNHGYRGYMLKQYQLLKIAILRCWRSNRARNIILSFLLLIAVCGCKQEIVHNLNEAQANRLITRLDSAGIKAEKINQPDGRWALSVATDDSVKALRYLDRSRMMPVQPAENLSANMISSREEQRFFYERSLSREIEKTLKAIDGVLDARVHLNLPPRDPLFGQPLFKEFKASASVMLVADDHFSIAAEELAALVSGASGVSTDAVKVLVSHAAGNIALSSNSGGSTPEMLKDLSAATETDIEAAPKRSFSATTRGFFTLPVTKAALPGLLLLLVGALIIFGQLKTRTAKKEAEYFEG